MMGAPGNNRPITGTNGRQIYKTNGGVAGTTMLQHQPDGCQ